MLKATIVIVMLLLATHVGEAAERKPRSGISGRDVDRLVTGRCDSIMDKDLRNLCFRKCEYIGDRDLRRLCNEEREMDSAYTEPDVGKR